ncbi:MAG: hypothetical protein RIS44_2576 [Pseudomonadota bacterium]|jgi:uncharacterized protein with NRDE domain
MCLLSLALDVHRRFPLVVAANRDEFFVRPAARMAWWTPEGSGPAILAGRDLLAGGTWLGLTAAGRLALITNVRNPARNDPSAPSRGSIVPRWLSAHERPDQFWARVAMSGHNGFNLIAADFRKGECFAASNVHGHPQQLERGTYGLSNAHLDAPWPKVEALKSNMKHALSSASDVDQLAEQLFAALADRTEADDGSLPQTGVSMDMERQLSPAFIRTPDGRYGTRCSTLIISERTKGQTVTHVLERTFSPSGGLALLRRSSLTHWPPRYELDDASTEEAVQLSEVSESESDLLLPSSVMTSLPAKRTRVRSLLKPEVSRKRPPKS